ncbi:mitochondrial matrix Mmp37 [Piedraia hortae CBS 480.64]|uniref:Phosphatidate cytidylyltransferase, mitochondrial n=1 Tax=Piedraia hortae CBS 480.64 TaxID=1314780 RepID=A0A6A7CAJ7_9PEZI|nr:mitochondrial matrix Mmp37 [Piedraia hortae CBS 480.64]
MHTATLWSRRALSGRNSRLLRSFSSAPVRRREEPEWEKTLPPGWDDNPDYEITAFSQLPHKFFGYNQHIRINEDFKEALRSILWQFRAPIRYAFAYGSGVFGQGSSKGNDGLSPHPHPPKAVEEWQKGGAKVIDFIFGVSHTEHWHSLNLAQHPDHYSGLKHLPYASAAISRIQDDFGAGVYFNPYITVNGVMIKYGVVNLDTLASDLSDWNTLYLAGRLQKPVKILRDNPRMRLANQVNLISALRIALLMLPEKFTERELYERIASLSYLGDPRMNSYFAAENPNKVKNIVGAQLPGFRQLYVPLIENLPNVEFSDSRTPTRPAWEKEDAIRHTGANPQLDDVVGGEDGLTLSQDMNPTKRGNMVRRLPNAFRRKLYFQYKKAFHIPGSAFSDVLKDEQVGDRREGGEFERRVASQEDLTSVLSECVRRTVSWPSTSQSIKGLFTAGLSRSWEYYRAKRAKSSGATK